MQSTYQIKVLSDVKDFSFQACSQADSPQAPCDPRLLAASWNQRWDTQTHFDFSDACVCETTEAVSWNKRCLKNTAWQQSNSPKSER